MGYTEKKQSVEAIAMTLKSIDTKDLDEKTNSVFQEIRQSGDIVEIRSDDDESLFVIKSNHERFLNILEDIAIEEKLKKGLADIRAGRTHTVEEVFAELRSQ